MEIRRMLPEDHDTVMAMMREFYASPALIYDGGERVYERTFAACVDETNVYAEGWLFESEGIACGYSILAHSFSTEYGMPCIWVEDLYLKAPYRGQGAAGQFFDHLKALWHDAPVRFRLEVEAENTHALHVYRRNGWTEIGYIPMETVSAAGERILQEKNDL